MNVGDKVLTVERSHKYPNGFYLWPSIITAVTSSYIETKYRRTQEIWLLKSLDEKESYHTFDEITVRNYFAPNGKINIVDINNLKS